MSSVVYHSLGQVLKTLGSVQNKSQVIQKLFDLCASRGLTNVDAAEKMLKIGREPDYPFIVIEGLDGTGKTTLTKFLSNSLNMQLLSTPPKLEAVQEARSFFDGQPESIKRAYYSLGNYLAAQDIYEAKNPVVMDRFWHSTAAYGMSHRIRLDGIEPSAQDFIWPSDLLKPDLVIFLQVSEQERIRRHTSRKDFTNTEEEQTLAKNEAFRNNLMKLYRQISGPKFIELNVDGEQSIVEAKILKTVFDHFPNLSKVKQQLAND